MYKCKIAGDTCPLGKDVCCYHCDDLKECEGPCEEIENEDYKNCPDLVIEKTDLQVMEETLPSIQKVTDLMIQVKKAEAEIAKIKESLLKAMQDKGIKKFENEKVVFTYVAPSTKTTFDKAKLMKEHPEIDYSGYNKINDVKAFVKIRVK